MPAKAPAPSGITAVRAARLLEALAIAPEHLDIRQQVMRERHRLRALQMRVAGHDRRDVPPRDPNQRGAQLRNQRNHAGQLVAQVKPHVECDLIVARSPGVQLAPRLANQRNQPPLDREMDIFVGDIELEASALDFIFDPLEPRGDRAHLARLEQSDLREHLRMRDRAANVVPKKPPIEWQRRGERFDLGQTAVRKSSADEILLAATPFHFFTVPRTE